MAPSMHVSQMAAAFLSPATLEATSSGILGASRMRMPTASNAYHVAGGTDDGEFDVFRALVLVVVAPF
ncbi:MAG: hypothetical protein L6435_17710 [Anaerolineae bacterium]|nr:hypothetical protein [Anaerolineae bacterium]